MTDKADAALAATLDRLQASSTLNSAQAEAVAREFAITYGPPTEPTDRAEPAEGRTVRSSLLSEVGGYIGAAFVFAACLALVAPNWDDLSDPSKVGLLAGPALLLLLVAAGLIATAPGGWSLKPVDIGPRRRLVSVLVLASGGLIGGAASVLAGENNADRVVPVTLLVIWACGYLLCRGSVLHLSSAAALAWTLPALVNPSFEFSGRTGSLLVLAGAGWAVMTMFKLIVERDLGIAVAGVLSFIGAETIVASDLSAVGYLLLAALTGLGLGGYLRTQRLSALAVGAITMAVVIPQALIDYTDGSFGPAGGLLICGLSIVAASALSMRLRKSVDATDLHRPAPAA